MISFKNLGKFDRLGNQLFQYAFTRLNAQRLGVPFYCPRWLGDEVFLLNDEKERAADLSGVHSAYRQKSLNFDRKDLEIQDGTDIYGFFQSEKYLDAEKVRAWYTFKPQVLSRVREKYRHMDFSKAAGLHLRFGDMKHNPMFVIVPPSYYRRALSIVNPRGNILVFSDDSQTAKIHMGAIGRDFIYIQDNKDYEDLYLMSQCRDFVCSVSTLSWWGAWLNREPGKTIVTPREWIRPGHALKCPNLCCPGWVELKTCGFFWQDYRWLNAKKVWRQRLSKIRTRDATGNIKSLKNFVKNKIRV